MKFLLVDTAFDTGIAALFENDKVIAKCTVPLMGNQSRTLFPAIQEMMDKSGIPSKSLDFIASGIGPGSYTGMRVGAMIAKCFAYTLKKPLVGVCSMEAFSPLNDGKFTVMIDARVTGAYFIRGFKEKNRMTFDEAPLALSIDEALSKAHGQLVTLQGNKIKQRIKDVEWQEIAPSPEILGAQAFKLYNSGNYTLDGKLDLLYLRPTQAELERKS